MSYILQMCSFFLLFDYAEIGEILRLQHSSRHRQVYLSTERIRMEDFSLRSSAMDNGNYTMHKTSVNREFSNHAGFSTFWSL